MKNYWRLIPALGWMALIFYLSSIPNLELGGELSAYDLVLRKLAHMFEYSVLYCLYFWGLRPNFSLKQTLSISFILSLAYAVSDEVHQMFVVTREGKPLDVLIDLVGIVSAYFLIKYWHEKNHPVHSRDSSTRD
jgi:VanZ family protein